MSINDYRTTTAYLQFEAERYATGMKLTNFTMKKPAKPRPGAIVVKCEFRIPRSAFEPLTPEAIVTIEESIGRQVVQVLAQDPGDVFTEEDEEDRMERLAAEASMPVN